MTTGIVAEIAGPPAATALAIRMATTRPTTVIPAITVSMMASGDHVSTAATATGLADADFIGGRVAVLHLT